MQNKSVTQHSSASEHPSVLSVRRLIAVTCHLTLENLITEPVLLENLSLICKHNLVFVRCNALLLICQLKRQCDLMLVQFFTKCFRVHIEG
jgi:hypothetical protein